MGTNEASNTKLGSKGTSWYGYSQRPNLIPPAFTYANQR